MGGIAHISWYTRPEMAFPALLIFFSTTLVWRAAKFVLRYLSGTFDVSNTFTECDVPGLSVYIDSDYAS